MNSNDLSEADLLVMTRYAIVNMDYYAGNINSTPPWVRLLEVDLPKQERWLFEREENRLLKIQNDYDNLLVKCDLARLGFVLQQEIPGNL